MTPAERQFIEAEAAEAARMPGWFWFIGPIVFVLAVAASAAWPWRWL